MADLSGNAQVLSSIVVEVTPQLFEAYGTQVAFVGPIPLQELSSFPEIAGVLGFVGDDLHGTITLATSVAVMEAVMRGVPGAEVATDWLAELTNQLLGRVKSRLLRCGTPVLSSTPVVVTGRELRVQLGAHSVTSCHVFGIPAGLMYVLLGAELADGVVLTEKPGGDAPPNEGDLLLF